jgi:hypothetical protein
LGASQLSIRPTTIAESLSRTGKIKYALSVLVCPECSHLTLLLHFHRCLVFISDDISSKSAFENIHVDFDAIRHAITYTSGTPNRNPVGQSEVYGLGDIEA